MEIVFIKFNLFIVESTGKGNEPSGGEIKRNRGSLLIAHKKQWNWKPVCKLIQEVNNEN